MAIDMCLESFCQGMSPRISFSYDLCQTDVVPVEEYRHRSDSSLLDLSSDFDFGVSESFEQESSSAEDLFFDGKIIPRQIMKITAPQKQSCQSKPTHSSPALETSTATTETSKRGSLKEIMATSSETEEKPPSKSFWRFRRSSSLNCENGNKRSLIFSLPLISRSNSTGSASNTKGQPLLKENHKQSQKPPTITPPKSSSSSSCSYFPSQKPPSKKKYGSYGNAVRISFVLNVPPPYISKGTANLFGLGSFFCSGKDKNKKK